MEFRVTYSPPTTSHCFTDGYRFAAGRRKRTRPCESEGGREPSVRQWVVGSPQARCSGFSVLSAVSAALLSSAAALCTPLPRRIVIRVGCFRRGTKLVRYVAQVHTNARPCRRAAAHGIDEDVVHSEMR